MHKSMPRGGDERQSVAASGAAASRRRRDKEQSAAASGATLDRGSNNRRGGDKKRSVAASGAAGDQDSSAAASGASLDTGRSKRRHPRRPRNEASLDTGCSKRRRDEGPSGSPRRPRNEASLDTGPSKRRRYKGPSGSPRRPRNEAKKICSPAELEYQQALRRPRRKHHLFVEGGGASFAEQLPGHDVGEMMLAWTEAQPAARACRGPAQTLCHDIMELYKQKRNEWRDDSAHERSIATMSIHSSEMLRRETSNWKAAVQSDGGSVRLSAGMRYLQFAEIEAILKQHEGEARVWQTDAECWEQLQNAAILGTIASLKGN